MACVWAKGTFLLQRCAKSTSWKAKRESKGVLGPPTDINARISSLSFAMCGIRLEPSL